MASELRYHVAIVGGGITGAMAASTLIQNSEKVHVTLLDQGRSVGGRSSHRRIDPESKNLLKPEEESLNGVHNFDHGCQFFRADDETFRAEVEKWVTSGWASSWEGRFGVLPGDGHGDTTTPTDFFGLQKSAANVYVGVKGISSVVREWLPRASAAPLLFIQQLPSFFGTEDPLVSCCLSCALLAVACLVLSWITGSCSQVDKLWSITPFGYVWIYTLRCPSWDGRLLLMSALSTTWGLRLTYNFARKGGYNGEEDYRWPELRRIISNPVLFQLFNISFIASFQNVLLMLMVGSVDVAYRVAVSPSSVPLGTPDLVVAAVFCLFLVGESIADQQQWVFQNAKQAARAGKPGAPELRGDYKRGFLTHWLFSYSRHPNFFCEQAMWVTFYLFSGTASGVWLNWTALGPVLLILLFQGSTRFTEFMTLRRYPDYVDYQRDVPMLAPLPGFIGSRPSKRAS